MDNTNILDTLDKEKLDMYMLDNISTLKGEEISKYISMEEE